MGKNALDFILLTKSSFQLERLQRTKVDNFRFNEKKKCKPRTIDLDKLEAEKEEVNFQIEIFNGKVKP